MLDTSVSNTGTIEAGPPVFPQELGLKEGNPYGGADVSTFVAKTKGRMVFEDCLGVCRFCTRTELELVTNAVNAATGWDMDVDEAMNVGRRTVNVLRAFNIRHGIGPDVERRPRSSCCSIPTPWAGVTLAAATTESSSSCATAWAGSSGIPSPARR